MSSSRFGRYTGQAADFTAEMAAQESSRVYSPTPSMVSVSGRVRFGKQVSSSPSIAKGDGASVNRGGSRVTNVEETSPRGRQASADADRDNSRPPSRFGEGQFARQSDTNGAGDMSNGRDYDRQSSTRSTSSNPYREPKEKGRFDDADRNGSTSKLRSDRGDNIRNEWEYDRKQRDKSSDEGRWKHDLAPAGAAGRKSPSSRDYRYADVNGNAEKQREVPSVRKDETSRSSQEREKPKVERVPEPRPRSRFGSPQRDTKGTDRKSVEREKALQTSPWEDGNRSASASPRVLSPQRDPIVDQIRNSVEREKLRSSVEREEETRPASVRPRFGRGAPSPSPSHTSEKKPYERQNSRSDMPAAEKEEKKGYGDLNGTTQNETRFSFVRKDSTLGKSPEREVPMRESYPERGSRARVDSLGRESTENLRSSASQDEDGRSPSADSRFGRAVPSAARSSDLPLSTKSRSDEHDDRSYSVEAEKELKKKDTASAGIFARECRHDYTDTRAPSESSTDVKSPSPLLKIKDFVPEERVTSRTESGRTVNLERQSSLPQYDSFDKIPEFKPRSSDLSGATDSGEGIGGLLWNWQPDLSPAAAHPFTGPPLYQTVRCHYPPYEFPHSSVEHYLEHHIPVYDLPHPPVPSCYRPRQTRTMPAVWGFLPPSVHPGFPPWHAHNQPRTPVVNVCQIRNVIQFSDSFQRRMQRVSPLRMNISTPLRITAPLRETFQQSSFLQETFFQEPFLHPQGGKFPEINKKPSFFARALAEGDRPKSPGDGLDAVFRSVDKAGMSVRLGERMNAKYFHYASDIAYRKRYAPGDILEVSVLDVVDPQCVSVLEDEEDQCMGAVLRMSIEMDEKFDKKCFPVARIPPAGAVVCAKNPDDKDYTGFLRAQVISEGDDKEAHLYFIDMGTHAHVKISGIYEMSADWMKEPKWALPFYILGMPHYKPPVSDKVIGNARDLLIGKKVRVLVQHAKHESSASDVSGFGGALFLVKMEENQIVWENVVDVYARRSIVPIEPASESQAAAKLF